MILVGLDIEFAGHHLVKFIEDTLASSLRLSLDRLVIIDADAFEIAQPEPLNATSLTVSPSISDINTQSVAAQRILAVRIVVCILDLAKISRVLVVVEDRVLVKIVQFRHLFVLTRHFVDQKFFETLIGTGFK